MAFEQVLNDLIEYLYDRNAHISKRQKVDTTGTHLVILKFKE